MDLLTELLQGYQQWISALSPKSTHFILRATLLFGLTTVSTAYLHQRGSRQLFYQIIAATVATLFVMNIDFTNIRFLNQPIMKAWVLTLSIVTLIFIPGLLPKFLAPRQQTQQRLKWIFYAVLGILLILN